MKLISSITVWQNSLHEYMKMTALVIFTVTENFKTNFAATIMLYLVFHHGTIIIIIYFFTDEFTLYVWALIL